MTTPHTVTRIIAGGLVSGGVVAAGFWLAAGTAQANPPGCGQYSACWCPGQRLPAGAMWSELGT
jgi:hypothetical protein